MRVRLLAMLSTAALLWLGAIPASASGSSTLSQGLSYLALGDSVPFGFNPLFVPDLAGNPNVFVGYPEIVAQQLHLKDVNAACPGETTAGFLDISVPDNGCHGYRAVFPLHVNYPLPETQMEFATAYLRSHHNTRLVTLMLGANDAFIFLKQHPDCAPSTTPPSDLCLSLLDTLFFAIKSNLNTILSTIRSTGYTGLIVAVTYYALNYANPGGVAGTLGLNEQMIEAANAHGALIASGFDAWAATALAPPFNGDTCAAGLRIVTPVPSATGDPCDVHPTPLGRDLLAAAVVSTVASSCAADNAVICVRPTD